MVTYIYFVQCPGCETEHFDFFDEAKEFALGRLSQKPIITQTEVCRNDFGECVDHCDLGTVWSWEDMMKDTEPDNMVFSKDETFGISEGLDDFDDFDIGPQIDEFDNSLDFDDVPDNFKKPITESYATKEFEIPNFDAEIIDEFEDEGIKGYNIVYSKNGTDIVEVEVWETDSPVAVNRNLHTPNLMQGYYSSFDAFASDLEYKTSKYVRVRESADKKPIPEGMTIEQLVEEMEENEDTVECTWCNDLFDKSECRYEVNLGYLCSRCEAAIKSRGETLTFRENNYWDSLEEEADSKKRTWVCFYNGKDLGTVEATTEEEAYEKMERTWPQYNFNNEDVQVIPEEFEEEPGPKELHDLGNTYDGGYPVEDVLTEGWQDETVDLHYDSLTAEVCVGYEQPYFDRSFGNWLPGEGITEEVTQSYTYKAPKWKVEEFLWEQLSDEYLEANFPGGLANLDDDSVVEEFTAAHLNEWIKTYNKELLEYFEEDAATAFANDYDPSDYYPEYDESLKSPTSKSVLEELEDSETYHARLTTCPECGEAAFDPETGICNNCGFNIL